MAGPGRIDVHHHMVPDFYRETLADPTAAKRLARECNEAGARIAGDHPRRFGWFAVLPLPLTGAAVEEAIFALDTLHADGVVLLASNAGTFLGDPAFEELMAQLDVRATVAFVHSAPARSAGPGARATLRLTQSPTAGTRRPPLTDVVVYRRASMIVARRSLPEEGRQLTEVRRASDRRPSDE